MKIDLPDAEYEVNVKRLAIIVVAVAVIFAFTIWFSFIYGDDSTDTLLLNCINGDNFSCMMHKAQEYYDMNTGNLTQAEKNFLVQHCYTHNESEIPEDCF